LIEESRPISGRLFYFLQIQDLPPCRRAFAIFGGGWPMMFLFSAKKADIHARGCILCEKMAEQEDLVELGIPCA
jgi:hypothetical protein